MVTPYAPWRDGIANYALQEVARLRAAGERVDVCSPEPSAAHFHLDLRARRGPLALAKRVRDYDKVIIQFHPDMFTSVGMTPGRVTEQLMGLAVAARLARRIEVRVHEVDFNRGIRETREALWWRRFWAEIDQIELHTATERDRFVDAFRVDINRVVLADHGTHFERRADMSRAEARAQLGLDPDAFLYLSIGFLQPHKGFDRGLRAFLALDAPEAQIHIVGSVRVNDEAFLEHVASLRSLAATSANAQVHEGYVDDHLFDVWLIACDVVVLPYRHIWSSGVIERAGLYERPVIATKVGGLEHQAPDNATLVNDDVELQAAMSRAYETRHGGQVEGDRERVAGAKADGAGTRPSVWADASAEMNAPEVQERIRENAGSWRRGRHVDGATSLHSASIRQVPPLAPPAYGDVAMHKAVIMRVVRKLTSWQMAPVERTVNELRISAIEAIESIETTAADTADRSKNG